MPGIYHPDDDLGADSAAKFFEVAMDELRHVADPERNGRDLALAGLASRLQVKGKCRVGLPGKDDVLVVRAEVELRTGRERDLQEHDPGIGRVELVLFTDEYRGKSLHELSPSLTAR